MKIIFLNGLLTPSSVNEEQVAFLLEELGQLARDWKLKNEEFAQMQCQLTPEDEKIFLNRDVTDGINQINHDEIKDDEDMLMSKVLEERSKIR